MEEEGVWPTSSSVDVGVLLGSVWGAAGEGKKPGGEGARGPQVSLHEEDSKGDGEGPPLVL